MQPGTEDENSDILLDIVEELTGNWLVNAEYCKSQIEKEDRQLKH